MIPAQAAPTGASTRRILARIDQKNHTYHGTLLCGALSPHGTVLTIVWQDKNPVCFLTTVHQATPEQNNFVFRDRNQPRKSTISKARLGRGADQKNVASTMSNRL